MTTFSDIFPVRRVLLCSHLQLCQMQASAWCLWYHRPSCTARLSHLVLHLQSLWFANVLHMSNPVVSKVMRCRLVTWVTQLFYMLWVQGAQSVGGKANCSFHGLKLGGCSHCSAWGSNCAQTSQIPLRCFNCSRFASGSNLLELLAVFLWRAGCSSKGCRRAPHGKALEKFCPNPGHNDWWVLQFWKYKSQRFEMHPQCHLTSACPAGCFMWFYVRGRSIWRRICS